MARLAIAAAGAVIGGFFGQPGIGWAAGSLLGGALFPGDPVVTEGPRLSDLRVMASTLGAPIALVYGAARIGGNVIWASAIRETRNEEEIGGKGGPSAVQVSYTYDVDFAVGLCAGPIVGVRRIWADGRLIYDASAGASPFTLQASVAFQSGLAIYTGSESQLPDPTMEAALGVGEVPAHRGIAYVVFSGFQLADYGNRIPQITCEVIGLGSTAAVGANAEPVVDLDTPSGLINDLAPVLHQDVVALWGCGRFNGTLGWTAGYVERLYDIAGNLLEDRYVSNFNAMIAGVLEAFPILGMYRGCVTYSGASVGSYHIWSIWQEGILQGTFSLWYDIGSWPGEGPLYDGTYLYIRPLTTGNLYTIAKATLQGAILAKVTAYDTAPSNDASCLIRTDSVTPYVLTNIPRRASDAAAMQYVVFHKADLSMAAEILPANWPATNGEIYGVCEGYAYAYYRTGQVIRRYTLPALTFDREWVLSRYDPSGYVSTQWYDNQLAPWLAVIDGQMIVMADTVTATVPALEDIVLDLCARAGLATGERDASALTATVQGYVIARPMSARQAIEPLRAVQPHDSTERDGVLTFVARGGAAVASLTRDDLVAAEGEAQTLSVARAQEVELPRRVWVNYLDTAADYQVGTQQAQRQQTGSLAERGMELAVAMGADQAARIAEVQLYDAWASRHRLGLRLPARYAALEPADVITIADTAATWRARIDATRYAAGLLEIDAVSDDASVLVSAASGAAPSASAADTLGPSGPTRAELLDTALLADAQSASAIWVALAGYLPGWPGGNLYSSADGGATWSEAGVASLGAVVGYAGSALGAPAQFGLFDETNTVLVSVAGGATLSSASELAVLNGANAALLGAEIIQFRTATVQASGMFLLSGLLRGRKGTEEAATGHAAGERFVLLDAARLFTVDPGTASYGVTRHYKAVTLKQSIADATPQAFANAGRAAKPLAPVHIQGGVSAGSDIVLNWLRRGRIDQQWRDYADVPLGETNERYDVEIYTSASFATLKRTFSDLSTPSCTYTAAQQVSDFGTEIGTVHARVYQKSASIGRGMPASVSRNVRDGYTSLLTHFDGANGSQTLLDVYGNTITPYGTTALSTTTKKFGTAALAPSGSGSGCYVSAGAGSAFDLAAGDFTLEGWFNLTSIGPNLNGLMGSEVADVYNGWAWGVTAAGALRFYVRTSQLVYTFDQSTANSLIGTATWYHLAVTRQGNILRMFINGTKRFEGAINATLGVGAGIFIGGTSFFGGHMPGYIDDVRISKGACRYTADFTAPAAAFYG